MKTLKIITRIILMILILSSLFMWIIIGASSHNIKTEMRVLPLIFALVFAIFLYLTKYLKRKEN
ncbi:hypothetical protein [Flavobacterium sp. UBA7680]|uniref:hypothetical protein n=1 Tax=Flavobacterium sp. UBA7680 TaxID=1946559 RepID=UPI0025B958C0|nr:hypothetical protein [Flavobacterium sp. UBA7680]